MNKRTFARTVIGAIVGVSIIPPFGTKPKLHIPPVEAGKKLVSVNWTYGNQLWISA